MRKKLLSIILSLAMVLTMIPAMGSVAYATDDWSNLHWEETTACWDQYEGATGYWVYLFMNGENPWGSGFGTGSTYIDLERKMYEYGDGKYTFYVVPYVDGGYKDELKSPFSVDYDYTAPPVNLTPPANLRWNVNAAEWDAVDGAIKYTLDLYKDGEPVKHDIITSDTSLSMTESMEQYGAGSYTFKVAAQAAGKTGEYSEEFPVLNYTLIPVPKDLCWEGNVAKWDAVPGASHYWLRVFKDGESASVIAESVSNNEYDITNLIKSKGCGLYEFDVAAYKDGGYGKVSVKSEPIDTHILSTEITKATLADDGEVKCKCTNTGCTYEKNEKISKISSVKLSTTTYTYNGKVKSPSLTVKDVDGITLINGTDYIFTTPGGRKNVGTYTYGVTFQGKYDGTETVSFKINPATPSIKSVSAGKKKMTVKMTTKPSSKGASTYQIYYKQKGTSAWKKTTTTSTSKTIKSLKKKKQYYVKVRAYKKVSGTTYYGEWSKTKLSKKIK